MRRTWSARLTGALLTILVGLIAVAGAYHDHALPGFETFHLCAPAGAAPPPLDHDCLACKIAPLLATPRDATVLLDPWLVDRKSCAPTDMLDHAASSVDPAAPRGPPYLPQA